MVNTAYYNNYLYKISYFTETLFLFILFAMIKKFFTFAPHNFNN